MTAPGAVEAAIGGPPVEVILRGVVDYDVDGRTVTGGDLIGADQVGPVGISRWRTRPDQRPEAAALTVELAAAAFDTTALPDLGDTFALRLTAAALTYFELPATSPARWRFVGTVVDVAVEPATRRDPAVVRLIAAGPRGRLSRRVGDTPWPAQLDGARAEAILTAAVAAEPASAGQLLQFGTIDPGTVTVAARDVDAQPAAGLLDALAYDSGGELVERLDGELEWHDAEHRRGAVPAVELWARHVQVRPAWRKAPGGLVNDLTLGYGDPGAGMQPTVRVVDQVAGDAVGVADAYRGTQLVDAAAATTRATDLVGRWGRPAWALDALTVDLVRTVDAARAGQLLALQFGELLRVDGLPTVAGAPTSGRLWVEGARESITRRGWQLQLYGSDYGRTGPAPRWADVPTDTTWADVPADLSWLGAVTWWPGDAGAGRWVDVPADRRWLDYDTPTGPTWADYTGG